MPAEPAPRRDVAVARPIRRYALALASATLVVIAAAASAVPPPPPAPRLRVSSACFSTDTRIPVAGTAFKPRTTVRLSAPEAADVTTTADAKGRVASSLISPSATPGHRHYAAQLITGEGADRAGTVRSATAAYLLGTPKVCRTLRDLK